MGDYALSKHVNSSLSDRPKPRSKFFYSTNIKTHLHRDSTDFKEPKTGKLTVMVLEEFS